MYGCSITSCRRSGAVLARNYSGSVVEVGAGYALEVALDLKARGLDVVLTDKEERLLGSTAGGKG